MQATFTPALAAQALQCTHTHTRTDVKPLLYTQFIALPCHEMAAGTSPALFMGVDGSGLAPAQTSSGPLSWQEVPLLHVPVDLFISCSDCH